MPTLVWSNAYELGIAPMDDTHREFVDLVNRIGAAGDDELLRGLDELVLHTVEHFAQEGRWMRESGFPPLHCHQSEHERVLEVMHDVRGRVAAGDLTLGRTLLAELPAWFDNHASTMDTALAWHVRNSGYQASAGTVSAANAGPDSASGCGCAGAAGRSTCG